MRLHTFTFSPDALKVRLALAELGVPHEAVEVDLQQGEPRTAAFAQPFGKVPVLEDGTHVLHEPNAILAYLGRNISGPLWPREPGAEALALQWLFFEASHLVHAASVLWWTDVVAPELQRPGADPVIVADAARSLTRALDHLESRLEDRTFLLGDEFTLVDCAIGVQIALLRRTRAERADELPRLRAYRERVRARPSWTLAHGDALHEVA